MSVILEGPIPPTGVVPLLQAVGIGRQTTAIRLFDGSELLGQLLGAAVAVGQRADKLPAHLVAEELQEEREASGGSEGHNLLQHVLIQYSLNYIPVAAKRKRRLAGGGA